MIELALKIALEAHEGQTDLDGKPAILHPLTVGLKGANEVEIIAGLLHDVVEDGHWTLEQLAQAGFSTQVIEALRLLTHAKDVPYGNYVAAIIASGNSTAQRVKMNDLQHNLARGMKGNHTKQVEKHSKAWQMFVDAGLAKRTTDE